MSTRREFLGLLKEKGVTDRDKILGLMEKRRTVVGRFDDDPEEQVSPIITPTPTPVPAPTPPSVPEDTSQGEQDRIKETDAKFQAMLQEQAQRVQDRAPEPEIHPITGQEFPAEEPEVTPPESDSPIFDSRIQEPEEKPIIEPQLDPEVMPEAAGQSETYVSPDAHKSDLEIKIQSLDDFDSSIIQSWKRGSIGEAISMAAAKDMISGGKNMKEILRLEAEFHKKINEDPEKAKGLINKVIEMLPAMTKGAALTLGTSAITSPAVGAVAGTTYFGVQGAGDTYKELRRSGVSHETAWKIAAPTGALYGAVENLQLSKIAGPALKKMKQEVIHTAIQQGTRRALKEGAKKYGANVVKNVGEEVAQDIIQKSAEEIGKQIEGISEKDAFEITGDLIKSAARTAKESVGPLALISLPGASISTAKGVSQAKQQSKAEASQKALEAQAVPQEGQEAAPTTIQKTTPVQQTSSLVKPATPEKAKAKAAKAVEEKKEPVTVTGVKEVVSEKFKKEEGSKKIQSEYRSKMPGKEITRKNIQAFMEQKTGKKVSRKEASRIIKESFPKPKMEAAPVLEDNTSTAKQTVGSAKKLNSLQKKIAEKSEVEGAIPGEPIKHELYGDFKQKHPLKALDAEVKKAEKAGFGAIARAARSGAEDKVIPGLVQPPVIDAFVKTLEANNEKYSIVSADGRNLGGLNDFWKNHQDADKEMVKMWGNILNKSVEKNGGYMTRQGGDELIIVFPGKSTAEAEALMTTISAKMDKAIEKTGYSRITHAKTGVPEVGALGIDFGVSEGKPGEFKKQFKAADEMVMLRKEQYQLDKAEKAGYVWSDGLGKFVPKKGVKSVKSKAVKDDGLTTKGKPKISDRAVSKKPKPAGGENGSRKPQKPPTKERVVTEPVKLSEQETPKAQKKKLSFPETAKKAGLPSATEETYQVKTNIETAKNADTIIQKKGLRGAARWVAETDKPSAEHTAVAIKVSAELQKKSRLLRETQPDEADIAMEDAISLVNKTSKRLMEIGQEIQAASMVSSLDPDAVVFTAQRKINKINKKLPTSKQVTMKTSEAENLRKLSEKTKKWEGLNESARNLAGAVNEILSKKPGQLNVNEIQTLRDYRAQLNRTLKAVEPKKGEKPKRKSVLKVLEETLDTEANAAMERFKKRHTKEIRLQAGLPLDDMADLTIWGAAKIAKKGVRFSSWAADMVETFGPNVKPHLKKIWYKSKIKFNADRRLARKLSVEQKKVNDLIDKYDSNTISDQPDLATFQNAVENIKKLSGDAKTEAVLELQQAMDSFEKPTVFRRLATLQTMAQLLNIKTIGRNIIGNEMFYRFERLNKYVATPIDILTSKVTGERTASFKTSGQSGYFDGLIRGSRMAWKGLTPADIETRFTLSGPAFQSTRNPFTWLERTMGVALRGGDFAAYNRARNQAMGEIAYVESLNQNLKGDAQKKFVQNFVKNASPVAAEMAHKYGKFATFQDSNILSDSLSSLKRLLNRGSTLGKSEEFGAGDLILKYPKTPGALIMRAIDYSPVGFVKGFYQLGKAVGNGEFNQREFVHNFSRAIVGTAGFTGIGYMLLMKGVLTGSPEDWREEQFKRHTTGEGPYKVNVSAIQRFISSGLKEESLKVKEGDKLVSYDWAQPLAVSLSLGANVARQQQQNAGALISSNNIFGGIIDALAGGIQTIAEQPLLSGIQSLFGGGFSNLTKAEQWTNSAKKLLEGIPASFTPTILYQVRQSLDNTAREAHDPNLVRKAFNKVLNRLPVFEKILPEQYTQLGIDKKTIFAPKQNTLFNVFLNPAFISKYKVDPLIEIILNPLRVADLHGQIPKIAPTRFSISKKKLNEFAFMALGKNREFKNADLRKKEKMAADFLGKKDVGGNEKSYKIEITGKERTDMQKFMADKTELLFRAALKGEDLSKLEPEQQEKLLGRFVNLVNGYAKETLIRKKLGLKRIPFLEGLKR